MKTRQELFDEFREDFRHADDPMAWRFRDLVVVATAMAVIVPALALIAWRFLG